MSWSETKKLSDVVIDSTRFSEVVTKSIAAKGSAEFYGSGILYIACESIPAVYIDGVDISTRAIWIYNDGDANRMVVPFSKSITISAYNYSIAVAVFFRDNISIGGGYSRVVPFNRCRKAVAA